MKKAVFFTVFILTLCLVVVGCEKKKEEKKEEVKQEVKNPIVGQWALGSFVYTFNEDMTCSYLNMNCTYKIDGDKISILYEGDTDPFETTFSIDGNKLNVRDSFGQDTIYTKKN